MTRPHLDLTQTHGQRRYGDITAFFSWHGDKREPCLAMLPTKLIGTDGVRSDGLRMKALPHASAGANFHIGIMAGKLNGVMPATTPSGWRIE